MQQIHSHFQHDEDLVPALDPSSSQVSKCCLSKANLEMLGFFF